MLTSANDGGVEVLFKEWLSDMKHFSGCRKRGHSNPSRIAGTSIRAICQ